MDVADIAPSLDDDARVRLAGYLRRCASPGVALALLEMNAQIGVRDVLPASASFRLRGARRARAERGRAAPGLRGGRGVELTRDEPTPHAWEAARPPAGDRP